MATKNLSEYNPELLPDASAMVFDIVVSEWNHEVTGALLDGALACLKENGVAEANIRTYWVPGSFELVYGAARLNKANQTCEHPSNAIIALGCVVRGGTPHFEYVCQGTTQGIAAINEKGETPVIFGLLTTDDMQQSLDRAGGVLGNKGVEAARTAIQMAGFAQAI